MSAILKEMKIYLSSRILRISGGVLVFAAIFVLQFLTVEAAAGVPKILSYQGRLSNSSGSLLGGSNGTNHYFRFSFYNASSGGTKLWPSGSTPCTHTLLVKEGVFNAGIGDTNECSDTLTYNFGENDSVYLQIDVSSDNDSFENLSPRQRILSSVFAQVSGAVSGTGQSSFGTTSPISNAIVTIEATSTAAVPLSVRGILSQVANLFRVEDSTGSHLFSINASGGLNASSTFLVGTSDATSFVVNSSGAAIGTASPSRKFNVVNADSVPQLRVAQSSSVYGELYVDSAGDIKISATGGHIRLDNENLWACSGGSCASSDPATKGNIILETSLIFDNGYKIMQTNASTSMYDASGYQILQFDEATE